MNHLHDHGWTVAGSASSLSLGLWAAAAEMPPAITLVGLLASIVTPVLVQWVRSRHDAELASLKRQNARLFDRLAQVVAERDARP